MLDGGFYNGWVGGYFGSTNPVVGTTLTTRDVADQLCQAKFGSNARVAEHAMARHMPWMNDLPAKIGANWDWPKTYISGWSGWGFMKG